MKKNEVPQDKSFLENKNMRELCYAVDENGNYITIKSSGWEPKTVALKQALESISARAKEAKTRVENGIASPIEFYMELHRMDLPVLASYVGIWQWRVKRHLKPGVFKKLPVKILQKYAEVFEITIDELQNIPK